jgi:hypothetical protein
MINNIIDRFENEVFTKIDGFDDAIIGVETETMRLIYSTTKCMEILCNDMSRDDALDYFNHNVIHTYVGKKTPIFCYDEI